MSPTMGDYKIVKNGICKDVYIYTRRTYSPSPKGYYEYWEYRDTFMTEGGARRYIRRRVATPKPVVILYQGNGKDI